MNIDPAIATARQSPNTLHRLFDKTFGPLATLAPATARNQRRLWWGGFGKLILMSAITFLLAASSAEAQKNTRPIGRLLPPNISIEDVGTGNFLIFNQISGDYTFTRCSDRFTLSGVGVVRVDGCLISLESEPSDHRVVASVDECTQEGKVLVEQLTTEFFKIHFSDENIGNNLLTCDSINQRLSIEDDPTGSFLVFDKGTGGYTFTRCSDGFTISGVGGVKVDGCAITLEARQPDHRVGASIDECTQQAKAFFEKFTPVRVSPDPPPPAVAPFKALLSDLNMSDNRMDCAARK